MKTFTHIMTSFALIFMFIYPLKIFAFTMDLNAVMFNGSQKSGNNKELIHTIKSGYNKWKGVRYKYGGTDGSGIDCSALTRELAEELNISLPRTTRQQIRAGRTVNKSELAAGDLVFFETSESTLHVGMYLENGQFIHASTLKGVTISSLDNTYWKSRYNAGVRVIS